MLVSPSLDGVLSHDSVAYEGVRRPVDVLRVLDGPARRGPNAKGIIGARPLTQDEREVLDNYFHDIHGVFMKKLAAFVMAASVKPDESLKLQALFQEMIKIKGMMG